jgi:nucleoside-diphosphate-sugar epimerase
MRDAYAEKAIKEDVLLAPPNHYGIWKLAGEHLARLFYDNTQVSTVCLRVGTTYGKGRDRGKTAAPTNALKAIALGFVKGEVIPFEMPYKGRENYHFVDDVGVYFATCTVSPYEGYGVFNIKGETITVDDFLSIVKQEADALGIGEYAKLSMAESAAPNLFVSDLSHEKIDSAFSNLQLTSVREGVRKSLKEFLKMAKQGKLEYSI